MNPLFSACSKTQFGNQMPGMLAPAPGAGAAPAPTLAAPPQLPADLFAPQTVPAPTPAAPAAPQQPMFGNKLTDAFGGLNKFLILGGTSATATAVAMDVAPSAIGWWLLPVAGIVAAGAGVKRMFKKP